MAHAPGDPAAQAPIETRIVGIAAMAGTGFVGSDQFTQPTRQYAGDPLPE